jgi:DHA3 family tetracycline resistance protein-like MFS transporter
MNNREAYRIYLILEGAFALFFYMIITVNMVYQVETAHLNPLELVLVGTMLETTAFVTQVPTGIVADVFSRRWSIIIGMLLTGAGFILQGSIPTFGVIVVSQLGWGIGSSFISGAEEAWIAEEVGEEYVGRVFLRGSQIGNIGALIGAVISVALASIRLNIPIVAGGICIIGLGVFLIVFMPEHNFRRADLASEEERLSWKAMRQKLFDGLRLVRGRALLLTILFVALFYGLYSEGVDRLWTAHLLTDFTIPTLGPLAPVTWFAVIQGVVMLLSIGATEIVRRRFDTTNNITAAWLQIALNTMMIAAIAAFALAGSFVLALMLYWCYSTLCSVNHPIFMTWLTHNTDPKVRATVISMSGQVDAIGQIAGGPIIGVIGTLLSIRAALLAASLLLSPALIFLGRAIQMEKRREM